MPRDGRTQKDLRSIYTKVLEAAKIAFKPIEATVMTPLETKDAILKGSARTRDPANKASLIGEFVRDYNDDCGRTDASEGSILHYLLKKDKLPPDQFLRWLFINHCSLIEKQDGREETPLHKALLEGEEGHEEFIKVLLEEAPDSNIKEALKVCDKAGNNCLHYAVQRECPYILELLQFCSIDTFLEMNNEGNTPLHLAMELNFQRSLTNAELPQIQENGEVLSLRDIPRRSSFPPLNEIVESMLYYGGDSLIVGKMEDIQRNSEIADSQGDKRIKRTQTKTPYQYRVQLLTNGVVSGTVNDDEILQKMKYYCLRRFPRDEVIDILYEDGKEKHIEFDLSSLPTPSISEAALLRLGKHLVFEDTLQYVALPKLRIDAPYDAFSPIGSQKDERNRILWKPPERVGFGDAKIIFDWLRSQGVKKIIKVIVVDNGDIPHSNEAIEDALSGFGVEIWNWKKLDIDSETVFEAASDTVRDLYLYSSGNNAVLRGWSCERGLVKLANLKNLFIITRKGFETEERRLYERNIFKREMADNWLFYYKGTRDPPFIRFIEDNSLNGLVSGFQTDKISKNMHPWLACTDEFARYIANIEHSKITPLNGNGPNGVKESIEHVRSQLIEDIKIAIIDDGIDGFEDSIVGNIDCGTSFSRSSDFGDLMKSYYVPSGNHGTTMARLICRVCPTAKLFVARLEEDRSSGKSRIMARSAADAIRWAIARKVHIISMSWAIEGKRDHPDIQYLEHYVKMAADEGIIMLCAFDDQGSNISNSFPGAFNETWTIGAATSMGKPCTWVDESHTEFLFPGERIAMSQTRDMPFQVESGSSVATALAAGMAAQMLHTSQIVSRDLYETLKAPAKLKHAFLVNCINKYFSAHTFLGDDWNAEEWDWDPEIGMGQERLHDLLKSLLPADDLNKLKLKSR